MSRLKSNAFKHASWTHDTWSLKKIVVCCVGSTLFASMASAGAMGDVAQAPERQHVMALSGGFANMRADHAQSYLGTDDNVFTYASQGRSHNTGMVGVFLGEEFNAPQINPALRFQAGLEYAYFGNNKRNGSHTVGIEPSTSTLYQYSYAIQSQQLMAVAKILTMQHAVYLPYVSVGLGAAFNHSEQFKASTLETGSVNLTPHYQDGSKTAFTYALGAGVETRMSDHLRFGLGYRFTDLGKASFGNGHVTFNDYSYPTAFTLTTQHLYTNLIVAQFSYFA